MLGLVVTDTLYRTHPDLPEGQLAKLRAAVVNMRALAEVGRELGLGAYIRLGRGEEGTGGRDKASILADTLEAVIGAVYLDQGLTRPPALVHRLFDPLIEQSATLGAGLDWKTSLQELTATEASWASRSTSSRRPARTTRRPSPLSPASAATRTAPGRGRSKKEAEQQAAESAWRRLRAELPEDGAGGTDTGGLTARRHRRRRHRRQRHRRVRPTHRRVGARAARAARGRGRPARSGPLGRRPHRRRRRGAAPARGPPAPGRRRGLRGPAGRPHAGRRAAPRQVPVAAARGGPRQRRRARRCWPTSA